VRAALYLGAILSLWPMMGVQLAAAFVGSLVFRANLMITGCLQFVTNPLTAAPIYYVTYMVGRAILVPFKTGTQSMPDSVSPEELEAVASQAEVGNAITDVVAALFVGGTVCGLAFALILDALYLWSTRSASRRSLLHRR
jgi:uncharacterized protein (DUF2062 family)